MFEKLNLVADRVEQDGIPMTIGRISRTSPKRDALTNETTMDLVDTSHLE